MQVLKVTATGAAFSGHARVNGITLIGGSAAASITLNDSTDGTGSDKGGVKTAANVSVDSKLYGQSFATGVYATISGTGAVAYIYIQ